MESLGGGGIAVDMRVNVETGILVANGDIAYRLRARTHSPSRNVGSCDYRSEAWWIRHADEPSGRRRRRGPSRFRSHHGAWRSWQARRPAPCSCHRIGSARGAVKDPDRARGDVGVGGEGGGAIRIERNKGGEVEAGIGGRSLLKRARLASSVPGRRAKIRSARCDQGRRGDAGQNFKRAIDIDDEVETAERRLGPG